MKKKVKKKKQKKKTTNTSQMELPSMHSCLREIISFLKQISDQKLLSVHPCDIVGQQGVVWTSTAKDRESWRTLAKGHFLQWKDTA